MTEERPKVGVGVFVWRNDTFFMQQRLGSHGEGSWSVPGGHLEFGESWEECARRETLEETGMRIRNIRFLAATNDIFTAENKHYVTIWLASDWESGEPRITEPTKCTGQVWCSFDTVPEPLFLPWQQLKAMHPELFTTS